MKASFMISFPPPHPPILILEISICGSLWLLCIIFLGSSFFPPLIKNPLFFWLEAVRGVKSQPHSYKTAESSVNYILKEFIHYNFHAPLSV